MTLVARLHCVTVSRNCVRRLLTLTFVLTAALACADNFNIAATERGWVCSGSFCGDNNGANPGNNYLAGFNVGQFRDWFEFAIPTLTGGPLVSATLHLDEPACIFLFCGHAGGPLTFAIYALSSQPMIFTDVNNTDPFFGSIITSSADDGTTISF